MGEGSILLCQLFVKENRVKSVKEHIALCTAVRVGGGGRGGGDGGGGFIMHPFTADGHIGNY